MTTVERLANERQKRDLGSARAEQENSEGAQAVSRARGVLCPREPIVFVCRAHGAIALSRLAPGRYLPCDFPISSGEIALRASSDGA